MAKKLLIVANTLIIFAFIGVLTAFAQVPDTTPPAITGVSASGITQTGATVNWTTDEAADGQVEYGTSTAYGLLSSLVAATTTAHSIPLTGLTASTTYHYLVKSKDAAGNLATSTDYSFTTLAPVADTTAPVISGVAASAITPTSAVIQWTTDEAADGQVEYGTSTAYGIVSALASATTTAHSVSLGSLTASTTYHYLVKSKDAAGNLATSTDYSFTTLAPATTTPPVVGEVTVRVKMEPRTLNVKSKGKWVQVQVLFPNGYDARDVELSSVKLNNALSPEKVKIKAKKNKKHDDDDDDDDDDEDDEDDEDDRESALNLKFSRSEVINLLNGGNATTTSSTLKEIVISGIVGGKTFGGATTVRLLGSGDLPDGTLLRASDASEVYVIINGKKRHIPSVRALKEEGHKWEKIIVIPSAVIDAYASDVLMRAEGNPAVYIISGGKKRHVTDPSVFEAQGLDWDDITVVSKREIDHYTVVSSITLIRAAGDKKVYFISGGKRQWIPSENVFSKHKFKWEDIVIIDESELVKYQDGGQLN